MITNPRAAEIHSLSVRAFNIVSAVVKVFETTTTVNIFNQQKQIKKVTVVYEEWKFE